MTRKFFKKFTTEELFTEFIYALMINRKTFMVFINNKQILVDEEVDEWNKVHGILEPTERILYRPIKNGYVITHTDSITNVTVPFGLLDMGYEEFVQITKEDY